MKTTIIGLGLIGGSMGLALRDAGVATEITGVDSNETNAAKALELGLVDRVSDMDESIESAELIIIATPVDSIPLLSIKILNKIKRDQLVIDVGSIKTELAETISLHPNRGRYVLTHPMWGTEYSGPEAAVKGAFKGRTVVICDRDSSDQDALGKTLEIYKAIGMPHIFMSSEEQDLHSAYISHISHITSFALALTVLEKEREEEHIFDLAGGGFESTVRLAKSSPRTWIPILLKNKYNVLDVLREHIHQLNIFRKLIEKDDIAGLSKAMEKANSIKKIIDKQ